MLLWSLALLALLLCLRSLLRLVTQLSPTTRTHENQLSLIQWFQRCEERLQCGFPLGDEDFGAGVLTEPEYRFLPKWIQNLRNSGQAILPSLKGMREATLFVNRILVGSQAKVAPTRMQAKVSVGLVFAISLLLYKMLEGPENNLGIWIGATAIALLLAGYSFLWIEGLILRTIWNGSQKRTEGKWFSYFLFPLRLQGAIQMGTALDEAWGVSVRSLTENGTGKMPPALASLWAKGDGAEPTDWPLEWKLLAELRTALQHALYQGTPVSERILVWAAQARIQFEAELQARLETLPHRCLQPLYLCVAPAVVGLLVTGLVLEVRAHVGGLF